LHIVFVESGYPHAHGGGGAGTYIRLVGSELIKRGHQVSVVTAYCDQCPIEYDDVGIQIFRPKLKKKNFHWYISKIPIVKGLSLTIRYLENGMNIYTYLNKLNREKPIDLLEFAEGGDFWHAFFRKTPYISHLHGSRYTFLKMSGKTLEKGALLQRKAELFFICRAAYVVSPSQAMLDVVTKENGRVIIKKSVIPLPLDPEMVTTTKQKTKNGSLQIFFASRNDLVKGGNILIKAIPLVVQAYPDVLFHIFGFKPEGYISSANLVLHDFLPKAELTGWLHQCDICVIPSLWDNSPNTVYEAMAAGKPVVASKVGGIPELIDQDTGILVQPGDAGQLASAILVLCHDEKLRQDMGSKGQQRIQKIADLEKNVDQRLLVYNEILSGEK
jgi:glycosyltransferase involved in cell wall biosynthesis